MINVEHLRKLIVEPVHRHLGMQSPSADNLSLGTAATESGMGTALKQYGSGPALGVWQVEPFTHADIWLTFLKFRQELAAAVLQLVPPLYLTGSTEVPVAAEALIDLRYCCAIARIKYKRAPEPLPAPTDWSAMERYHKVYYNSNLGATKPGEFIRKSRSCGLIL